DRPLESMKRRILKVTKLRDTRVLEIAATLRDPKQAQALAQYVADETVNLNRGANSQNDSDLLADAQTRLSDSQRKLEQEQAAWHAFSIRQPYETARSELEALTESRDRAQRDLLDARADLAEATANTSDSRLSAAKARLGSLEKQDADLA